MANPTIGNWLLMKRLGRYLKGSPRLVQVFRWQDAPYSLDGYTDRDWAVDKKSQENQPAEALCSEGTMPSSIGIRTKL